MSAAPLDGGLLAAADVRMRESPELAHAESLVVVHHDEVVFERYDRGRGPDDLADTHSVTKSFTSTLIGLLVGDGDLSLDAPVLSLLGRPAGDDARRSAVTVRHLLTMTSGLYGNDPWDLCVIALRGQPWAETALDAPLVSDPGCSFGYNSGAAHALSAVISVVTGTSAGELAEKRLFGPLGIDRYDWPADPQGRSCGSGHLALAPRDLAKLGSLFLRQGRWQDGPVVDPAYVAAATGRQADGGFPEGSRYGFLWWVDDLASPPAYFAAGHGGQYIYVVPALDLVAVATTDAYARPRALGRPVRGLIEAYVVAAARGRRTEDP